jgi:hypothetical protein
MQAGRALGPSLWTLSRDPPKQQAVHVAVAPRVEWQNSSQPEVALCAGYSTNYTETLSSVEVYDPSSGMWTEVRLFSTLEHPAVCDHLAFKPSPATILHRTPHAAGIPRSPLTPPVCPQLERPMPTPRGDVMCTTFNNQGTDTYVVVGGYW